MILGEQPLITIYDILSLTNTTLVTSDTILWRTKMLFQFDDFYFLFHIKNLIPSSYRTTFVLLTSCTPTKPDLYFANSLVTVVIGPELYRLLTFHVPNRMSHLHCWGCTNGSVQDRGNCNRFVTRSVFMVRSCYFLAQPQAERPPLFGCPQLLIQYIRRSTQYWRLFLYPQPEDAPCCGDKSQLLKGLGPIGYIISTSLYICLFLGIVQSVLKSAYTCFWKKEA
jgi:hypothetical protein